MQSSPQLKPNRASWSRFRMLQGVRALQFASTRCDSVHQANARVTNQALWSRFRWPPPVADIQELVSAALTNKIDDRELFMKGIDYSYYYEEIDG
jgi:hypothetical protein